LKILAQLSGLPKEDLLVYGAIALVIGFICFSFVRNSKRKTKPPPKEPPVEDLDVPKLSFEPQKPLSEFNLDELRKLVKQTENKYKEAILAENSGKPIIGGSSSIESDLKKLKIYLYQREKEGQKPSTDDPPIMEPPNNTIQIDTLQKQIDDLKITLDRSTSFAGEDTLFCPSTGDPMDKVNIEGETIDVSKAGCWFDGGELISILGRNNNFLNTLRFKISSIDQVEKAITDKIDVESRKKLVTKLCQQFLKTHDVSFKKQMDFHNSKLQSSHGIPRSQSSTGSSGLTSSFPGVGGDQNSFASTQSPPPRPNPAASSVSPSTTYGGPVKCPASGQLMTKEIFDGVTLDVSPSGIWFDGRGHAGNTEPELLSILRRKPGFINSLLGKNSPVVDGIEKKVDESASESMRQNEISECKRKIHTITSQMSRLTHTDPQFARHLSLLQTELSKLGELK
jgi:predicted heme/steroid binding protein